MFITLEGASRVMTQLPPTTIEFSVENGRHFIPNIDVMMFDGESGETIRIRTNSLGTRGPEPTMPKPDGLKRVLVIGDSLTAATAIEEEDTYCGKLQTALNSASHGRWEVINGGIPRSGTADHLLLSKRLISALEPDVVVLAFGVGTDVKENSPGIPEEDVLQFRFGENGDLERIDTAEKTSRSKAFLREYVSFYNWQKLKVNDLGKALRAPVKRRDVELDFALTVTEVDESPEIKEGWAITHELMRRIHEETKSGGCKLIVMGIPSSWQVYDDRWQEMLDYAKDDKDRDLRHPERRVLGICDDLGVPYLSLLPGFREQTPSHSRFNESERLHFYGQGHMNIAGQRVVADILSDTILRSPSTSELDEN